MQLHYKSYGSGQPLIILHGLLGSLDNWRTVSLDLAHDFRILTPDLRNHGHSPQSEEMNYSVMAQDVSELMNHENLKQAYVLGHSMGGKTAMELALKQPERVSKLTIVDMAPRPYAPRHAKILSAMLTLDLSTFQTRRQLQEALAPAIPDLAVRQFLLKNLESDSAGTLRWRIGLRQIFQNYDSLRQPIESQIPFNCPTLFIRGEHSDYLTESDIPSIQKLFPLARLETVPQAGHWVHADNPAVFVQKVREFLARDNFPLPA
jgi:pimeloyl-ACP methyl ester carboxylesterase